MIHWCVWLNVWVLMRERKHLVNDIDIDWNHLTNQCGIHSYVPLPYPVTTILPSGTQSMRIGSNREHIREPGRLT